MPPSRSRYDRSTSELMTSPGRVRTRTARLSVFDRHRGHVDRPSGCMRRAKRSRRSWTFSPFSNDLLERRGADCITGLVNKNEPTPRQRFIRPAHSLAKVGDAAVEVGVLLGSKRRDCVGLVIE